MKAPKVDNGRMRFLTRKEATMLLNALKTRSTDVYDMTVLSLFVGLRFGEIASLTWQDVDLHKGVLTIRDAKAGSRYASWLIDQGADLYTVRKLLGHKTNVMTQRYAHLSENRLKDAAKALGKAWQRHEANNERQKEDGQAVNIAK